MYCHESPWRALPLPGLSSSPLACGAELAMATNYVKRGRPSGSDTPERLALNLRLPAGGVALVEEAARQAGLPVATWIRLIIMRAAVQKPRLFKKGPQR